ncbi:MAG: esterase [Chitinophagaceae bacterium]|nr:esterase [Chitinophagaceae bacterium]
MTNVQLKTLITENHTISSTYLLRDVKVDCYLPAINNPSQLSLLLVNDGQDLVTMKFDKILDTLYQHDDIMPVLCVGIHCSTDRKNEYGTAKYLDYKGRGAKAALFNHFVFEELLPFIRKTYQITSFKEKAYAGFSLGGLCALDIVWNHAMEFTKVGVFSGSLWWRDKDQEDEDFNEDTDRIMHRQIREGKCAPWLQFFFEVGTQDETADRNNNGVIDAIDDTVSLIDELEKLGYNAKHSIKYVELKDGRHDVPTWANAFPTFLKWGWGVEKEVMD